MHLNFIIYMHKHFLSECYAPPHKQYVAKMNKISIIDRD